MDSSKLLGNYSIFVVDFSKPQLNTAKTAFILANASNKWNFTLFGAKKA
ncbi:hypothetical protein A33I_18060 [Alkalihalophilus marmarensis DSM 21297]|uniref:Uncharacterized protein n=1 Tax=Alkalihalophilus marmarensis DSM 21297 TaxID=1188261 RepID=U6SK91_9BACI|nr:hypothetical protein A33I_18060 [Alkalihalophilus marmarensis DSM 21297]